VRGLPALAPQPVPPQGQRGLEPWAGLALPPGPLVQRARELPRAAPPAHMPSI